MARTLSIRAWRKFCEGLGQYLNNPDYYKGIWGVSLVMNGRRCLKPCSNYTTAKAWVNYLGRHGFTYSKHELGTIRL